MKTSTEALVQFKKEGKQENHFKRILSTLEKLNTSCSKEIAKHSNLTYIQVSRRLKELELLEKIKVVDKRKTKFYKTSVNIYSLV